MPAAQRGKGMLKSRHSFSFFSYRGVAPKSLPEISYPTKAACQQRQQQREQILLIQLSAFLFHQEQDCCSHQRYIHGAVSAPRCHPC